MNTLTATLRRAADGRPARPATPRGARPTRRARLLAFVRQPVVGWVGVMLVATFSFYVHLLHEQVERGETLRAASREAAASPAAPARHPPLRVANRVYR